MAILEVDAAHVALAKRAFSTRRVPPSRMATLLRGRHQPDPGDLVLARVDELGKQTKIELTDGRRAHLFPGDEIVVSFGNRYAPDQYEAVIGPDLSTCDLVAAGGIAGVEISRHQRMLPPTRITPLGLIGDASGERLNLMQFRVDAEDRFPAIPAILSLGTSMNAGKTLTATSMVRGLKRAGFRVAAMKITGTGAGGDMWIVRDAGADVALDFTDAGFATTYLAPVSEIERATFRLLNHAASLGCEIAVIEIADGLQQLETAQLIRSEAIQSFALGTVFAAYDAMGAKYGVDVLRDAGHDVLAMSGRLGRSPLGVREAEAATGLRVYSPLELQECALIPAIRERLVERAGAWRERMARVARTEPAPDMASATAGSAGAENGQPAGNARPNDADMPGSGTGQVIELPRPHAAPRPAPHPASGAADRAAASRTRAEIVRLCARGRQRLEHWAGRPIAVPDMAWTASVRPVSLRVARHCAAMVRAGLDGRRQTASDLLGRARAIGDLLGLARQAGRTIPLRLIPQSEATPSAGPAAALPDTPPLILSPLDGRPAEGRDAIHLAPLGPAMDGRDPWAAIARDFEGDDEGREAMRQAPDIRGIDGDDDDEHAVSTGSLFQPPHAVAGE